MFGKGISYTGDVLDLAANLDIINKSGAWYTYNGDKIGQGRENAKQYMEEHPEFCAEIDAKVREHYGLPAAGAGAAPQKKAEEKAVPESEKKAKGKAAEK
jgi:recombination protein RecA